MLITPLLLKLQERRPASYRKTNPHINILVTDSRISHSCRHGSPRFHWKNWRIIMKQLIQNLSTGEEGSNYDAAAISAELRCAPLRQGIGGGGGLYLQLPQVQMGNDVLSIAIQSRIISAYHLLLLYQAKQFAFSNPR